MGQCPPRSWRTACTPPRTVTRFGRMPSKIRQETDAITVSRTLSVIFDSVWQDLEAEYGRDHLRFPKELILLGGAPGAGKGTNTMFISRARGLTCPPIVMSALLDSPEAKAIKDAGQLVGDREVLSLLLRKLLHPRYQHWAIIDGFPRTQIQVDSLKRLVEKMHELRR